MQGFIVTKKGFCFVDFMDAVEAAGAYREELHAWFSPRWDEKERLDGEAEARRWAHEDALREYLV